MGESVPSAPLTPLHTARACAAQVFNVECAALLCAYTRILASHRPYSLYHRDFKRDNGHAAPFNSRKAIEDLVTPPRAPERTAHPAPPPRTARAAFRAPCTHTPCRF